MRPPPQWWMMVGLILNCEMTVKCTSLLNIAKQTNEIQTIVALRPRCPSSTKLGSQPSESRKHPWCGCDKRHEVQHDLRLHVRPLQVISNDWWLLCSCDSDISIKFWYQISFEVFWSNLIQPHKKTSLIEPCLSIFIFRTALCIAFLKTGLGFSTGASWVKK